nr:HAMP domain-containing histidine kinase [Oscillospiraceae bacterium]
MRKNNSSAEEKSGYVVKVREAFDQIRHQKKEGFSLKWRLFLVVAIGGFVNIWLGYGVAQFLRIWGIEFDNTELSLLISAVSLVLGLAFSFFTSKWIFKPIDNLRGAMEKVADGNFEVRLTESSSSREIQEVYSGFNLMVNEISSTEMLRKDFTSDVSHEFKTPIAAIEGYSTLLQGSDNLDLNQQEYIEKILYNTGRLSGLVGNILLLSKLENQSIETNQQTYRLDEQIRESLLAMESEWIKKNIQFDVELDSVKYLGNEGLMRHVWDNLISNAVKFSPEGGLVKLSLIKKSGQITFVIEDEGPGIPEDAKKRIFDKFYQHDNSRKQEGHGLGLPLVKRILLISGGKIWAENADGGGSRFVVILEE